MQPDDGVVGSSLEKLPKHGIGDEDAEIFPRCATWNRKIAASEPVQHNDSADRRKSWRKLSLQLCRPVQVRIGMPYRALALVTCRSSSIRAAAIEILERRYIGCA